MFNRSNCDRKSQLSGILTEPLNPRDKHKHMNMNMNINKNKNIHIHININMNMNINTNININIVIISIDPPFKKGYPLQKVYPLNLYLINNVKDIVVFLP